MSQLHDGGPEELTLLMANYNNAEFVAEAIDSVIAQTSGRWRLIVVDDASTDHSVEVIGPYTEDPRIRLAPNPKNLGYIPTLMRLISLAETDLVAILDSDDALRPHAVSSVLAAFDEDPSRGFVYTRLVPCDAALVPIERPWGWPVRPGDSALDGPYIWHLRTFRRSIYARTGGLDPAVLYAEDQDLTYKLEEQATPHFVPEAIYLYRHLDDSQSHAPAKQRIGRASMVRARFDAVMRRKELQPGSVKQVKLGFQLLGAAARSARQRRWAEASDNVRRLVRVAWRRPGSALQLRRQAGWLVERLRQAARARIPERGGMGQSAAQTRLTVCHADRFAFVAASPAVGQVLTAWAAARDGAAFEVEPRPMTPANHEALADYICFAVLGDDAVLSALPEGFSLRDVDYFVRERDLVAFGAAALGVNLASLDGLAEGAPPVATGHGLHAYAALRLFRPRRALHTPRRGGSLG